MNKVYSNIGFVVWIGSLIIAIFLFLIKGQVYVTVVEGFIIVIPSWIFQMFGFYTFLYYRRKAIMGDSNGK